MQIGGMGAECRSDHFSSRQDHHLTSTYARCTPRAVLALVAARQSKKQANDFSYSNSAKTANMCTMQPCSACAPPFIFSVFAATSPSQVLTHAARAAATSGGRARRDLVRASCNLPDVVAQFHAALWGGSSRAARFARGAAALRQRARQRLASCNQSICQRRARVAWFLLALLVYNK